MIEAVEAGHEENFEISPVQEANKQHGRCTQLPPMDRKPRSFGSRDWELWKRHTRYLYYFIGGFALKAEEHAKKIQLK